jgi:hypothetical protein
MIIKPRPIIFLLLLSAMFLHTPALGEEAVASSLHKLVGENRLYRLDFLFFKHLAEGTLKFEETDQPDIFRAELKGRTLGIASWLSGDRTQTYSSTMQLMPDGSLNTLEHVAKVKKKKRGKWRRYRKVCQFDCASGIILEEKIKQGAVVSSKEHHIPEGQYPVDMLTAFYNLRLGVYGKLQRGSRIYIPTYSSKGFTDIEVYILTVEEQKKKRAFPKQGMLVKAIIDPDIFETDTGNLYVWFDDAGNPARGIIEDMIGLGDIRGVLMEDGS